MIRVECSVVRFLNKECLFAGLLIMKIHFQIISLSLYFSRWNILQIIWYFKFFIHVFRLFIPFKARREIIRERESAVHSLKYNSWGLARPRFQSWFLLRVAETKLRGPSPVPPNLLLSRKLKSGAELGLKPGILIQLARVTVWQHNHRVKTCPLNFTFCFPLLWVSPWCTLTYLS